MPTINQPTLVQQLLALGVQPGGVLLVHAAFSKIKPVEGGPGGLIEALRQALGPAGTLVMPSMSYDDAHPFDPATTPCPEMGIVAETFWQKFALLYPWLEQRQCRRRGTVGHGETRLARSRDIVSCVTEHLRENATVFLHPKGACAECDDAWRSMPGE